MAGTRQTPFWLQEAKGPSMVVLGRRSPQTARHIRPLLGWLSVLAALTASGCASKHDQLVAFLRSQETQVATGQYVVRPPDVIAFHSPDAPELDGMNQAVRSDGKVVLRLIGEVDVAGLTTEEIAAKVKTQLSRYYVDPEVLVEVTGYNSQFYYVFGEVGGPARSTSLAATRWLRRSPRPSRHFWRGSRRSRSCVRRPAQTTARSSWWTWTAC